MSQKDRIIDSWNRNAAAWTTAVRTGAIESRRLVTDQAIVDAVLCCPGNRVLDVGCGEGWLSRKLAEAGRSVTGFDVSRSLIASAAESEGPKFITLSYQEFSANPFEAGGAFDVAVCNFSLLDQDIVVRLESNKKDCRRLWAFDHPDHPPHDRSRRLSICRWLARGEV